MTEDKVFWGTKRPCTKAGEGGAHPPLTPRATPGTRRHPCTADPVPSRGSDPEPNAANSSGQASKPQRTNFPPSLTFPRHNTAPGDAESLGARESACAGAERGCCEGSAGSSQARLPSPSAALLGINRNRCSSCWLPQRETRCARTRHAHLPTFHS